MVVGLRFCAVALGAALAMAWPAGAAETPKRGGTLTYMISADAPPTFDGHRETTYATVHAAAPIPPLSRSLRVQALVAAS